MSKVFRPMLAVNADLDKVQFPVLVSPKYDGVRAIVRDGVVLSRSLKPIPNPSVQRMFRHLEGADGELLVGSPTSDRVYSRTVSYVMSEQVDLDEEEYLQFVIFDATPGTLAFVRGVPGDEGDVEYAPIEEDHGYRTRLQACRRCFGGKGVTVVAEVMVERQDDLLQRQERYIAEGYEGLMLRDPAGTYKYGRSTVKEGGLLKVKLFEDDEATIIGYEEKMHNANDHIATTEAAEAAGLRKRSTRAEGLVPTGVLGALLCRSAEGIKFGVGSGFTDLDRQYLWNHRENLVGKLVKYRHQPSGRKEAPRFPVFLGFRSELDL